MYIINPSVLQILLIFMTKDSNRVFSVSFLYAVAYNGELYIFGGYNARLDRHFNDLWKFNPGKLGKSMTSCLTAARECPAMIMLTGSDCVFSHITMMMFCCPETVPLFTIRWLPSSYESTFPRMKKEAKLECARLALLIFSTPICKTLQIFIGAVV